MAKMTKSGNVWVKTKVINTKYGKFLSPLNVPKPFSKNYSVVKYQKGKALLKRIR